MMRKNKFIMLIIVVLFLFVGKVNAVEEEDVTCNTRKLTELRQMASNVKVTYISGEAVEQLPTPNPEVDGTEETLYYLDVKIFNLNSKLGVKVTTKGKNITSKEYDVGLDNMGSDGAVTLRQWASGSNIDYEFKVYAIEGNCTGKTLRTLRLTIPKFNVYSDLDICKDVPDYYLCLRYTTYDVDGATFYDRVDEYKAKMLVQNETENNVNNTVSRTLSNLSKYKYVIVGIVVAVGVVITVLILRRKKSEV